MCSEDGRISFTEFNDELDDFVQKSKALGDHWEFGPGHDKAKYLVKHCFREVLANIVQVKDNCQDSKYDTLSSTDKDDCEAVRDNSNNNYLKYEYHVTYSPSYGVPVLYFITYTQDGCPLGLQDVWSAIPHVYQQRLQAERWTFLTQQEHPFLGKPFFQLHPCHTADMMKCILMRASDESSLTTRRKTNYLVTWLSSVGPVVGLELPLAYGT
ncbi:ubiquitin-like-conjugating enzyme ATG10 isoform X2 [Exaiptasia diaphana]|uniref:Ubiquitin-like-conjugating enzyme ATG10 n=1 Tax=Exaiptasia diaphana TaxID=2652724 RepID=A0A913WSK8_EXADI|nr:ubiquitin-like-conjugating enzyme ATG10 isoform X2 [Exaiptasia diaphana]